MTAQPVTVGPTALIGELAQKMVDAHIHRVVVVVDESRPQGIVTSTDVLAAVARGPGSRAEEGKEAQKGRPSPALIAARRVSEKSCWRPAGRERLVHARTFPTRAWARSHTVGRPGNSDLRRREAGGVSRDPGAGGLHGRRTRPLLGADLLRLKDVTKVSAGVASVGGAGTFDAILLSWAPAVLLA